MKKHEYLINGKQFVVEILSFDGRKANVRVNNTDYRVEVPETAAVADRPHIHTPPATQPSVAAEPPRIVPQKAPEMAPATTAPPPLTPPPETYPSATSAPEQAPSDNMVVAPMPGIILSILVKEGDDVSEGQAILVLEAMKMENEIHASRAGKVKKIYVSEGAEVRAGSELVEIE